VAASGPVSARIAAELGDGLFTTEPDGGLVDGWQKLGGSGPVYGEVPLAWAPDEDTAVLAVVEKSRFALTGWKVMAELPNPVNFEGRDREHHHRTGQVPVRLRSRRRTARRSRPAVRCRRIRPPGGSEMPDRTRMASWTSSPASWPGRCGH
jgi:hypothetical protein